MRLALVERGLDFPPLVIERDQFVSRVCLGVDQRRQDCRRRMPFDLVIDGSPQPGSWQSVLLDLEYDEVVVATEFLDDGVARPLLRSREPMPIAAALELDEL